LKKELFLLVFILIACFLFVAACGTAEEAAETVAEEAEVSPDCSDDDLDQSIVVKDQMGREVTITGYVEKIISLSPSNTEVAFALGLGDRLVGVTEFCNYPPEAQDKEIVGGFATPSIEKIVELEPSLVLASTIHAEEVPRLEELGIPVLVVESSNLADLYTSILLVAAVTGVTPSGEALVASMEEKISVIGEIVSVVPVDDRIRVFYEVYSDPLMSAGKGAFITEIISLAGGTNIFGDSDENYPMISAEVVAERQPEIILFPDYHGTADLVLESMTGRPGWESVPAVINGRVFAVSDDTFARPGPRIVEAIEEAARLFYPELF
jgi:iron complex transport system substrate-binding protein